MDNNFKEALEKEAEKYAEDLRYTIGENISWKDELKKHFEAGWNACKEYLGREAHLSKEVWNDIEIEPPFGGEYNVLYDLEDGQEPLVSTMDYDKNEKKWYDTRGANIVCDTVLKWRELPQAKESEDPFEDSGKNYTSNF